MVLQCDSGVVMMIARSGFCMLQSGSPKRAADTTAQRDSCETVRQTLCRGEQM